jgi:hypothetical protein
MGMRRIGLVGGGLVLILVGGVLPAAHAGTVVRTDPRGDVPVAKKDITRTRLSFGHRLKVRTSFVRVRSGTAYFALVDPGRLFKGDQFLVSARVRRDGTTASFLAHADREAEPYMKVRCAGLRPTASHTRAWLKVSVPARCLSRYGRLGWGAHVQVQSAPKTGISEDYLPDPPHTIRVRRD